MRWLVVFLLAAACAGPGATEVLPGREAVTTVALGPQDALGGPEAAAGAEALADRLADEMRAVLPDGLIPDETALFKRIDASGAVWSASPLNDLDFSGIGWGGGTIVTMITDRHGIVSGHVPREVGSDVRFVTRDGWPVVRKVAAKTVLARLDSAKLDIAVVRLAEPVPSGVAVYPLAAMDRDVGVALRGQEAPLIVTHGGRRATVSTLAGAGAGGARLVLAAGSKRLGLAEDVAHAAKWGDSGHPWFFVVDGRLVLASHYHTNQAAGAGPNYADARVRAMIERAVADAP